MPRLCAGTLSLVIMLSLADLTEANAQTIGTFGDNGTGLPPPLDNNVWCLSRNDSAAMPTGAGFTINVLWR